MRGPDIQQDTLFSTVSPEQRVPKDHPLRPIRRMVDEALKALDSEFNAVSSILVPPARISYRSKKHTTYDAAFKSPDASPDLLPALDQAVLHDSVLNIAMAWKNVWKTFSL